MLDAKLIMLQ